MSVEWIRARCRCDRCMLAFDVELDAAEEAGGVLPSLFDIVEDAVRGGVDVVDGGQTTSVAKMKGDDGAEYNEMLCGACTALEDAKVDE